MKSIRPAYRTAGSGPRDGEGAKLFDAGPLPSHDKRIGRHLGFYSLLVPAC